MTVMMEKGKEKEKAVVATVTVEVAAKVEAEDVSHALLTCVILVLENVADRLKRLCKEDVVQMTRCLDEMMNVVPMVVMLQEIVAPALSSCRMVNAVLQVKRMLAEFVVDLVCMVLMVFVVLTEPVLVLNVVQTIVCLIRINVVRPTSLWTMVKCVVLQEYP